MATGAVGSSRSRSRTAGTRASELRTRQQGVGATATSITSSANPSVLGGADLHQPQSALSFDTCPSASPFDACLLNHNAEMATPAAAAASAHACMAIFALGINEVRRAGRPQSSWAATSDVVLEIAVRDADGRNNSVNEAAEYFERDAAPLPTN